MIGAVAAACCAASRPAGAQGWSQLPSGGYGYTTDITATGAFGCGPSGNLPVGASCAATANSVTLGNGGAFMTLTFTGTTQTITAATDLRQRVAPLGTITKTFGGTGPFTFPLTLNPNAASGYLLLFGVTLTTTVPLASSGRFYAGYLGQSPSTLVFNCCAVSNYAVFPVTAPPPAVRGSPAIVADGFIAPTFTLDAAPITVEGVQFGIVPEPATVALTAAGLAGVGLAAARRRRA